MSVRNDSHRAKVNLKRQIIDDVGMETGFVRLTLEQALDLQFAAYVDGKITPITHPHVRVAGAEVVVPYKAYHLAVKAAPRYVRRRLARVIQSS